VHHPSDVAGGAVIGVALAQVAARLWPSPTR
jgi:membrane-associated phospholipid phosphatase